MDEFWWLNFLLLKVLFHICLFFFSYYFVLSYGLPLFYLLIKMKQVAFSIIFCNFYGFHFLGIAICVIACIFWLYFLVIHFLMWLFIFIFAILGWYRSLLYQSGQGTSCLVFINPYSHFPPPRAPTLMYIW